MLVFIDDSGDPGFKLHKGSSLVFVINLIIFDDELEAERTSIAIKDLRRKLKFSDKFEFKFNKSNKIIKDKFFRIVKTHKFKIRAIVINKEMIQSSRLKSEKEYFYNYTIMQVLKNNNGKIKNAKLRFDKRGDKSLRNQLRVYLSNRLENKSSKIFKDLKFVDSRENTLIQLADMVAGAIFASFSGKDGSYLKILRKARRIDDIWVFK